MRKYYPRLFALLLACCTLACVSVFAQAPNFSYNSPVTLKTGVAVGTAPNPNIAPIVGGGAVPMTLGYRASTSQPLVGGVYNGALRGAVSPTTGNIYISNNNGTGGGGMSEFTASGSLITNNFGSYNSTSGLAITGMAFDASGNLYVLNGNTLFQLDPSTGGGIASIALGSTNDACYGVAADGSGNIYVTDYNGTSMVSSIFKVTHPTSTTLASTTYITTTSGTPKLNGPVDIGFDSSNNLYVINFFNISGSTASTIVKFPSGTPGNGTLIATLPNTQAWAMRVDAVNNYVYAEDHTGQTFYVYNTSGTQLTTFNGPADCHGLFLDGYGGVYAPDNTANVVYKYSPNGSYFLNLALPAALSFNNGTGAITGTGSAASTATNYTITGWNNSSSPGTAILKLSIANTPGISYATPQVYNTSTTITSLNPTVTGTVTAFGYNSTPVQPLTGGVFNGPGRGAVDASGNIYVANFNSNTISKFTAAGVLITNNYTGYGSFSAPGDIVFDSSGNMYVANALSGVVLKFDPTGNTLLGSVSCGGAIGLAIDPNNNIYVACSAGIDIITPAFSSATTYLTNTSNMSGPVEVGLDNNGYLYVLNATSGKIYQYTTATDPGTLILTLSGTGSASYGMEVDASHIYVYDDNNKTLTGYNATSPYAGVGSISAGYDCRGLFSDGKGNIFAPDFTNNLVYEYTPSGGYFINKLLPGLTFNATTGAISGTTSATSSLATDYTVTAYNGGAPGSTVVNITVAKTFNWIGATGAGGTVWTTGTNWQGGAAPGNNDQVLIGFTTGAAFTVKQYPVITANTTIGSIKFGTATTSPTLQVTAGTLTVGNDITFDNNTAASSQALTLSGAGTISAVNLNVNNTGNASTAAYTTTVNSTISNLTLSGDVILTSTKNTNAQNATVALGQTGSVPTVITIDGVKSSNVSGSTSTFSVTGANTTLNFTGAVPFTGLSSSGTNALTLTPATIGYTGNNSQTVYTSFGIPNSSLSATGIASYSGIAFSGSGIKSATAGVLAVSGNFTNTLVNDANDYVNLSGATAVNFTGTTAQALAGGGGVGITFSTVNFSNAGAKTMTGNFTLLSTGTLTMVAGATSLATGGGLTLNSDVLSSATIASIPSGASITGSVNVQRAITGGAGKRGYRLLSSPVNAGPTNPTFFSINYIANSAIVTGLTPTTGGINASGNPTLYLFRENTVPSPMSFTGGNFRAVDQMGPNGATTANINYVIDGDGAGNWNLPLGNGFLFFFRGDLALSGSSTQTSSGYVPTNTTFTAVGQLNTGNITVNDWFTPSSTFLSYTSTIANNVAGSNIRGYNLVGNPYAATINWEKYNRQSTTSKSSIYGSGGLSSTIYIFNSSTKQYATYTQNATVTSVADTTTTVFTAEPTNSSDGFVSNMIASGQGFFIVATALNSQSLTFRESAKSTVQAASSNLAKVFAAATPSPSGNGKEPAMRVKLLRDDVNTDAVVLQFNSNYSPNYDNNDLVDLGGDGALVSLSSLSADSVALTVNKLALPQTKPVISKLAVDAISSGRYTIKMDTITNLPAVYSVWLKDNLLNDSLDMRANRTYGFTIDKGNAATFGDNRFQLIIGQNAGLALHLLNFTGSQVPNTPLQSQLVWVVENESNYTTFNLQRSTDGGNTFNSIDNLQSDSSGHYSFVDKNPVIGKDFYRLQLTDLNGNVTYSQVIAILFSNLSNNSIAGTLSVYPNPAHDMVNISINSAGSANAYSLIITSNTGSVVKKIDAVAPSSQQDVSSFVAGTYYITMIDNGTKTVIAQNKFVKL